MGDILSVLGADAVDPYMKILPPTGVEKERIDEILNQRTSLLHFLTMEKNLSVSYRGICYALTHSPDSLVEMSDEEKDLIWKYREYCSQFPKVIVNSPFTHLLTLTHSLTHSHTLSHTLTHSHLSHSLSLSHPRL